MGQQIIVNAGADACLQFAAADTPESYLIGVQSTVLGLTKKFTRVRAIAAMNTIQNDVPAWISSRPYDSAAAPDPLPVAAETGGAERENEWKRSGDVLSDHSVHDAFAAPSSAVSTAADAVSFPNIGDIDVIPEAGDIVTLPNSAEEWVVHTVGTHALWLLKRDEAASVEETYPGRINDFSARFDTDVYPVVTDYFGAPKLGNSSRLVVQLREQPERVFEASGFLQGPPERQWKMITIGMWLDSWRASRVLAHELMHVLQFPDGTRRYEPWFHEGHAELGTEIFDFAVLGLSIGQNYHRGSLPRAPGSWIPNSNFAGIAAYFGGNDTRTPQECSWLVVVDGPEPCAGHAHAHHVGWSLFRWLTDQYARLYPGGQRQFHQELLRSEVIGPPVEAIEEMLGETMETLLARWAAALYVDDHVADADPTLQFTSWNMREMHRYHYRQDNPYFGLYPVELPYAHAQRQARVRDGSIWYLRVSGDRRPATAISVRDRVYGSLPDDIQVWAVRLE